jgi:Sec-independent protein translocase protein TatA
LGKIPELMKGLGSGIKFQNAAKEDQPADKKKILKSISNDAI